MISQSCWVTLIACNSSHILISFVTMNEYLFFSSRFVVNICSWQIEFTKFIHSENKKSHSVCHFILVYRVRKWVLGQRKFHWGNNVYNVYLYELGEIIAYKSVSGVVEIFIFLRATLSIVKVFPLWICSLNEAHEKKYKIGVQSESYFQPNIFSWLYPFNSRHYFM